MELHNEIKNIRKEILKKTMSEEQNTINLNIVSRLEKQLYYLLNELRESRRLIRSKNKFVMQDLIVKDIKKFKKEKQKEMFKRRKYRDKNE